MPVGDERTETMQWPYSAGGMAACIRAFGWTATPLGPVGRWPRNLKTIVDLMLDSPSMMSLVWGPEAIHLYNDAFTELLREHGTTALGRSAFETFARSRDVFAADVAAGMAGRSARFLAQRYPVLRDGRLQDAWFDVDYAPIRDAAGKVDGVLWTLRETTAQVAAERALRESEARHRLLIGSWAQALWETSPSGVVVADSPSWRAYTGQTLTQMLGFGWLDAIHPDDRGHARQQWREAVDACGVLDAEFRICVPGGGWRWTNVRAAPVRDAQGAIEKWAGMNIDIDVRKRAEDAMRESEDRFRTLAETAPALIWRNDEAGRNVFINRSFTTYTGLDIDRVSGEQWQALVHPDDAGAYVADYLAAVAEQRPFQNRNRIRRHDGAWHWFENYAQPLFDAQARYVGHVGVSTDITTIVEAERVRRESDARQTTLMEGIPQLVWRSCDQGRWTWSSAQWQHFTGQGADDSRDFGWLDAIFADDRDATMRAWRDARHDGRLDVEHRVRRASDGAFLWHRTRSVPVRDQAGSIIEWLGTTTDVQQLKALQERQTVLVAELQHRTRNLMGVVRSMADKTARASADLADFRHRFRTRLEALARVQGLLSRLDEHDRVAFDDLLHTELSAMNGGAERVTLRGPTGVRLRSSTVQTLAMALHELATNALKYGALGQAHGHLAVTWSLEPAGDRGRPWLHVDWRESGVVMPPAAAKARGGGQGRELIEKALPYQLDAKTSYTLGTDGVHCSISVPVSASHAPASGG